MVLYCICAGGLIIDYRPSLVYGAGGVLISGPLDRGLALLLAFWVARSKTHSLVSISLRRRSADEGAQTKERRRGEKDYIACKPYILHPQFPVPSIVFLIRMGDRILRRSSTSASPTSRGTRSRC